MAKKDRYDVSEGNKRKRKKKVVLPFILCLLIAIVIWLYASATDEKDSMKNSPSEASLQSVSVTAICEI